MNIDEQLVDITARAMAARQRITEGGDFAEMHRDLEKRWSEVARLIVSVLREHPEYAFSADLESALCKAASYAMESREVVDSFESREIRDAEAQAKKATLH